jgi:hypothetical protein
VAAAPRGTPAPSINFLVKPEEKRKYDALFDQLKPQNGLLPGEKVGLRRNGNLFFLLSSLVLIGLGKMSGERIHAKITSNGTLLLKETVSLLFHWMELSTDI